MHEKSQNPSVAPIVEELDGLFNILNREFFNSELPKPVITLSQKGTRAAKGWCTTEKVWADKESNRHFEINICPKYLKQPVEEICEILLHEMVHLLNITLGIEDCTSGGQYHNRAFQKSAEAHGLIADQIPNYGYAGTSLKPETLEYIRTLNLTAFNLYRDAALKKTAGAGTEEPTEEPAAKARKPSSTRRYMCPKCKTLIRATRQVKVRCDECNVLFEETDAPIGRGRSGRGVI